MYYSRNKATYKYTIIMFQELEMRQKRYITSFRNINLLTAPILLVKCITIELVFNECTIRQVLKIFVEHGVELNRKDGGQNVVHVIIRMAYFDLESEEAFKETYATLMSYLVCWCGSSISM